MSIVQKECLGTSVIELQLLIKRHLKCSFLLIYPHRNFLIWYGISNVL